MITKKSTAGWSSRLMPSLACCKTLRRERDPGDYRRRAKLIRPGELLQHYGTDEQKDHYLPRRRVVRKSLALH